MATAANTPLGSPVKVRSSFPPKRNHGIAATPPNPPPGSAGYQREVLASTAGSAMAQVAAGAGAGTAGPPSPGGGGGPEQGEAPVITDTQLCVEILSGGFVQSYVDFFYLTHRPDPNPEPNAGGAGGDGAGGAREINVPPDDMVVIKDNLTTAEKARRQGETATVYKCYNNLAQYFQQVNDPKTGVYFYEKCLEIARLTSDVRGEMEANHNLGRAHEALGKMQEAIDLHERHLELAKGSMSEEQEKKAAVELVKVYLRRAEELEGQKEYRGAVAFHEKCLRSAGIAEDRVAEGQANYRLDRAHGLLDDPEKAIGHLEEYIEISRQLGDEEGEGAGRAALAAAYQSLQNTGAAIKQLEGFLRIARQTHNQQAEAEACCNLGVIYNRGGEFQKAVQYFEKNFEIARSIVAQGRGDRSVVDNARVNVGMARGNLQMGSYMNVINFNLTALLRWKNRRVNFARK